MTFAFFRYRDMTEAKRAGKLRAYALGVILDALSLNASIATVTVIDDTTFDHLFRDLVATNPEGEVVLSLDNNKSIRGLPFDEHTVPNSSCGNLSGKPAQRA